MRVANKKYIQLVFEAKSTLEKIENYKMHIADLAIKACTIKLGGHLKGFYSITNFAEDTGINRKTLSDWIHSRNVQKELENNNIKVEDETELNKIRNILKKGDGFKGTTQTATRSNNSYSSPGNFTPNARMTASDNGRGAKRNPSKYSHGPSVLKAYEKSKICPEDRQVENMIQNLKTIRFRLESYVLPKLKQENLEVTHTLVKDIDQLLVKHFSRKKVKRRSKQKTTH